MSFFLVLAVTLAGTPDGTTDYCTKLKEVLRTHRTQSEAISIRYVVHQEWSKEYFAGMYHAKGEAQGARVNIPVEWYAKGGKSLMRWDTFRVSRLGQVDELACKSYMLSDGAATVSYSCTKSKDGLPIYSVSKSPVAGGKQPTPWSNAGEIVLADILQLIIDNDKSIQKVTMTGGAGKETEIVVTYFNKWVNEIIISKDYLVKKVKIITDAGKTNCVYDQIVYEDHDGYMVPVSSKMEMGHQLEVVRIETVQIVTDPSKIDDSLFEIKLPRDAHVYDADAKMVLRNSEQVQDFLDSCGSLGRIASGRASLLAVLSITIVACALGVLIIRRWGGTSHDRSSVV